MDRAKNNNSVRHYGRKVMGMKNVTAIAVMLGISAVSHAQSQNLGNFYVGGGLVHNTLEFDDSGIELKGSDIGFKLFGGYDFNKYFAAEIAYIDGGEVDDSIFGVDVSEEATAFQAALFGRLPVNEMFSVYGKLGLLAWDAEGKATDGFTTIAAEDDGNDPVYGIGGALKFGRSTVRLEYEMADIDDTDMRLLSLSFAWAP